MNQIPDRRHRVRATVTSMVAVAMLAACSSTNDASSGDDAPATRTVSTVVGEVEVPVAAERIVTTHNIATQPLVDLGVTPVGVGDLPEEAAYPDYWEQIADIPQVGNGIEVDLERIAELEPDLIFAINSMEQGLLGQLSEIAPVVVVGIAGPQRADWQGRAELVAEATGRDAELAELTDRYAERADEIATTHADTLDEETFVVLDSFEAGTVVPYGPTSMVGEVLEPAGIRFAPSATSDLVARVDENPDESLSMERLPELTDGSVVLYGALASSTAPNPAQQELLDSPLLAGSDAARDDQLYPIGKTLIAGYGDALACLDLFEAALEDLAAS